MKNKKIQIILTLFLIALFPLTTTLTFQATGSQSGILFPNITTSGVGNFVEDFTTDVFKDPATTAWGWGTGTVTNDRNYSTELLDFYPTEDPVVSVDVEGHKAFTAFYNKTAGPKTIGCFKINDPNNIKLCSSRTSWSNMLCIAVDGDVLYSGRDRYSMTAPAISTYYVTDPFDLDALSGVYLTQASSDGAVTDIELNGHLAYYTAYDSTSGYSLRVLYAENPAAPDNITASWVDSSKALGLDVVGNLAYVAAAEDGFYVVNVSDLNDFFTEGYVDTPGNATDVVVDGRFAYLAAGDAGIYTIDLIDKNNPQIVGHIDTPGHAHKLVLQGNTLFVADGGGVVVLDVADPTHPTFVTIRNFVSYVYDVDLFGGTLVVGSADGLHTLALQAGIGIADIANTYYENSYTDREAWDVRVRGDLAYVAGGPDGFYILNVRDPNNPILVGNYSIPMGEIFQRIDIDGDIAHLVGPSWWYTFDIRDPANIKNLLKVPGSNIHDVYAIGDILYISFGGTVCIINCTNPNSWIALDYLAVSANITAVWVQGKYLYAAEYTDGSPKDVLWIYDVTDFTAPVLLDGVFDNSKLTDIYVDGDIVYASERDWSLIFNTTNPTAGFWTDWTLPPSYGTWGFGPYQLSANAKGSVDIINVTDIENTKLLYSNLNASSAWKVTTNGDYTYVANKSSLVILRHFKSAGDTYHPGSTITQSLEVGNITGIISEATLDFVGYVPAGTAVEFFLSADGGANWELVTPGTPHIFVNPGGELLWKAEIHGPEDRSVHLYEVTIDFDYNAAPTIPELSDPGTTNFAGIAKLTWNESTDDVIVDHYIVQMSDTNAFGNLLKNVTTTTNSKSFSFLSKGTYYFRVLAVDDTDLVSAWSNVEDLEITFGLLSPMWLGIFGGALVLIIVLVVVISVVVRRKKKIATR